FAEKGLADILTAAYERYSRFIHDKDMLTFFKVLYAERASSPAAAQILLDETESMISSVKALFYSLVVHGRMKNEDVDTAAVSYAMTIHSLVDREMDRMTAGSAPSSTIPQDIEEYIRWFAKIMEA
ncbi:MAG: TetR/AcrR family transcriptional regulator C-terminal domain-containing protein, partial [Oscillospiraceae bacterium]|nr:TetR/AcrR family transcriptional regulator C-terminal domain-containing protein [Oscillospiraceae bacterium]